MIAKVKLLLSSNPSEYFY